MIFGILMVPVDGYSESWLLRATVIYAVNCFYVFSNKLLCGMFVCARVCVCARMLFKIILVMCRQLAIKEAVVSCPLWHRKY